MSKTRSSQKKVTLSELNNHATNNKRQALKDLNKLNFDEIMFKTPAQKRFYNTIAKKDLTFCIGPAGCGKTYLFASVIPLINAKGITSIIPPSFKTFNLCFPMSCSIL